MNLIADAKTSRRNTEQFHYVLIIHLIKKWKVANEMKSPL